MFSFSFIAFYLNLSFKILLGLKVRTNLGGTSKRCLDIGLTDIRSNFFLTSNAPKFCMAILSLFCHFSVMICVKVNIKSATSLDEFSLLRDNSAINSLLFTVYRNKKITFSACKISDFFENLKMFCQKNHRI